MCSKSFCSARRSRMNTDGLPTQALKRKKTRRLKKRRLQDYQKVDSNNTPIKKGRKQIAAPENTTQFIMADQEQQHFNFEMCSPSTSPFSACSGSDSTSSVRGSPVDDQEFNYCSDIEENFDQVFFENDFNKVYDNIHAETLFELTKQELINRYLNLEKKEEELIRRVKLMSGNESMDTSFVDLADSTTTTTTRDKGEEMAPTCQSTLVSQLQELRNANSQLLKENERLRGC